VEAGVGDGFWGSAGVGVAGTSTPVEGVGAVPDGDGPGVGVEAGVSGVDTGAPLGVEVPSAAGATTAGAEGLETMFRTIARSNQTTKTRMVATVRASPVLVPKAV
jgi:hypothetical protein